MKVLMEGGGRNGKERCRAVTLTPDSCDLRRKQGRKVKVTKHRSQLFCIKRMVIIIIQH